MHALFSTLANEEPLELAPVTAVSAVRVFSVKTTAFLTYGVPSDVLVVLTLAIFSDITSVLNCCAVIPVALMLNAVNIDILYSPFISNVANYETHYFITAFILENSLLILSISAV